MAASFSPECGCSVRTTAVQTTEVSRRAVLEHGAHQSCSNTSPSVHGEDHLSLMTKKGQTRSLQPGPLQLRWLSHLPVPRTQLCRTLPFGDRDGPRAVLQRVVDCPARRRKTVSENNQALFALPTRPPPPTWGLAGLSLSGQRSSLEALATWGAASAVGRGAWGSV